MWRIQNVQEGKRHKKKETSSCFCLCSLFFGGKVSNSWILNNIGRNFLLGSRKKIAKCLMMTFTCRSTFLYGWGSVHGTAWCKQWICWELTRAIILVFIICICGDCQWLKGSFFFPLAFCLVYVDTQKRMRDGIEGVNLRSTSGQ